LMENPFRRVFSFPATDTQARAFFSRIDMRPAIGGPEVAERLSNGRSHRSEGRQPAEAVHDA